MVRANYDYVNKVILPVRIQMRPFRDMPEIEEFKSKGFVKASKKTNLLHRLRKQYGDNFRIFKCGSRGCGHSRASKYGSRKIFGCALHYYYDVRRKEEFVKFLVEEFNKNNPLEDRNVKRELTKLLHSHGLHWKECLCNKIN